jgi:DnaJ-domain-containing protein 1
MARQRGANKMGFAEGYKQYNPRKQGYGTPTQWQEALYERMGFEQAQRVKQDAQQRGTWRPEHRIIADAAGVVLGENSLWNEIKTAFRKAAMNTHPDRATVNNLSKQEAEQKFQEVQAAYAILERRYGK